jgi:hypothetical protein
MIAGAPTPAVQQAIPRAIQQELRLNPEAENHFQVLSARAAPFLIICPGPNIRDAIVANSPFEIPELEAEFGAVEWSPDWGMIIQRPTHEAWLTITDLPLQAWNREDIRKLLARYGVPVQFEPYGLAAGNFDEIRLRLVGGHPMEIHRQIMYKEGDFNEVVNITLHYI